MRDKPEEECGVVGIACSGEVAPLLYLGLRAIQHRGQESAGIATYSNEEGMKCVRGMGLVHEVFSERNLEVLTGNTGIGHVRYSTVGASKIENAQPMVVSSYHGDIALGHNGEIVNAGAIRTTLKKKGWAFITSSDTEIILRLIADKLSEMNIFESIKSVAGEVKGSYSIIMLVGDRVYGVRDSYGIKPLCIGRMDNGYVLASESVCLDILGAELIRDVKPGEIVEISHDGMENRMIMEGAREAHCMFEWVYFARPDSIIDGVSVYEARRRMGYNLSIEKPVGADIVIPVPDSGRTHALGYSESSGTPYTEGLMKNRYVERTFILPESNDRHIGVKVKLNAIKSVIGGKRIVLVDDSIVRGTTMKRIVKHLKSAGAREVHVRIGSPKIISPCHLGIDMKEREQFIA